MRPQDRKPNNPSGAKLSITAKQTVEMRKMRANGLTNREIAIRFGISEPSVSRYVRGTR